MRAPLLCSFLVLAACGGSGSKPAASEADTSSLESSGGTSGAAASAPPSSDATGTPAPAASSPTASAAATPAPATDATPASIHPVPGATGDVDGKPFSPKLAQLVGPVAKDGRALVLIHTGSDCVAPEDAKSGEGAMLLMVPWKDGYKTDLSSLRRTKGSKLGEAAFVRNKQVSATFKPSGLITVVSAATGKGATGKMKIDLQSGGYILAGDLDVKVCGQ